MVNPFRTAWNAFWGVENDGNTSLHLKKRDLFILLRRSQIAIRAVVTFQALLLILWATGAVVPGFGFYDGMAGVFNAISHPSFWLAWEIFLLYVGGGVLSFEVSNTVTKEDDPQSIQQVRSVRNWIIFWVVLLVIGMGANITHIVACGTELSNCSSTLCMNYSGFLIAFVVLLSILIFVEVTGLYYACIYKRDLRWLILWLKQSKRRV